jgi:hypothetical protein
MRRIFVPPSPQSHVLNGSRQGTASAVPKTAHKAGASAPEVGCGRLSTIHEICSRRICAAALAALLAWPTAAGAQRKTGFTIPTPLPAGSTLIVGFLTHCGEKGGIRDPSDQLATRLRALGLPRVYIETVGGSRYGDALKLVWAAAGRHSNGACGPQGCRDVRYIFYGYDHGALEMVKAARRLKSVGAPVALAVEITNEGACSGAIPSNVARAANICLDQRWADHGRKRISAEDPARTQILANLRPSSDGRWLDISEATQLQPTVWYRDAHMELDPLVWNHVEDYILDELRRAGIPGAPAPPH